MSKPTELWFKAGVCKAVVNNLKERGYKPQRREYLEGIKDVDKAYVIANRYIRNYIPLDDKKVKKEFWKASICCDERNNSWAIKECKKYATINVYLDQLHQTYYQGFLTPQQILECFDGIGKMPRTEATDMMGYHVQELMGAIQNEFIDDEEKCIRIAHLEILFMNLLNWEGMRCLRHIIKSSPEVMAQIVSVVFKKDHNTTEVGTENQDYIHNMYTIYEKAHFCPAEVNGEVSEQQLEQWIEKYKSLLIYNDQQSLFGSTLGRLLSFSPVGKDGHEPCEAVRAIIEKYGDDKLIKRYQIELFNRRGVFSPSAGKEELKMAAEYRSNAQYLEPTYPKTAQIFYGLAKTYTREAEREREEAVNGW